MLLTELSVGVRLVYKGCNDNPALALDLESRNRSNCSLWVVGSLHRQLAARRSRHEWNATDVSSATQLARPCRAHGGISQGSDERVQHLRCHEIPVGRADSSSVRRTVTGVARERAGPVRRVASAGYCRGIGRANAAHGCFDSSSVLRTLADSFRGFRERLISSFDRLCRPM